MMVIFIIGVPLIIVTLRDTHLPESRLFITAYLFLVFSNIFTVLEGVCFESLLNFLEHLFVTIASIIILVAVCRLTSVIFSENDSTSKRVNK